MNIKPVTAEEAIELQAPPLLKEGNGQFEVVNAIERLSSSGNNMIELKLNIWDSENKKLGAFDFLLPEHPKMKWKVREFYESVGRLEEYEGGILDLSALIGCDGNCTIKTQKAQGDYPARSVVNNYKHEKVVDISEKKEDNLVDDDVPF